ncbi:MAG: M67 family metallopeptidase [Bryobacteraceae bacterium]|jgi:proteasome lid subunit RPN8/RPN11
MLTIHPEAWRIILEHVAACYPQEGCGVLAGFPGAGEAVVAVACRNASPGDRRTRFHINPEEILTSLAQARAQQPGQPIELVGFFHSHPDRDPDFSAADRQAGWHGCVNLVVAVRQAVPVAAACYRLDRTTGEIRPEPLAVFGVRSVPFTVAAP